MNAHFTNITYERFVKPTFDSQPVIFFWGAHKTGKTALLKKIYPQAIRFDLGEAITRRQFSTRPTLLRESLQACNEQVIIIDEVQKVPQLVREIDWCQSHLKKKFILVSSAPKFAA